MTPAMMLGVADHIWSVGELIEVAEISDLPKPPGHRVGHRRVIDGGVS